MSTGNISNVNRSSNQTTSQQIPNAKTQLDTLLTLSGHNGRIVYKNGTFERKNWFTNLFITARERRQTTEQTRQILNDLWSSGEHRLPAQKLEEVLKRFDEYVEDRNHRSIKASDLQDLFKKTKALCPKEEVITAKLIKGQDQKAVLSHFGLDDFKQTSKGGVSLAMKLADNTWLKFRQKPKSFTRSEVLSENILNRNRADFQAAAQKGKIDQLITSDHYFMRVEPQDAPAKLTKIPAASLKAWVRQQKDDTKFAVVATSEPSGGTVLANIDKRPAPHDALKMTISAYQAVLECIRQGVEHNDLKPANICFTEDMRINIINQDGIVKISKSDDRNELTKKTMKAGISTARYKGSEKQTGSGYTSGGRFDLQAMGTTMSEIIAGKVRTANVINAGKNSSLPPGRFFADSIRVAAASVGRDYPKYQPAIEMTRDIDNLLAKQGPQSFSRKDMQQLSNELEKIITRYRDRRVVNPNKAQQQSMEAYQKIYG